MTNYHEGVVASSPMTPKIGQPYRHKGYGCVRYVHEISSEEPEIVIRDGNTETNSYLTQVIEIGEFQRYYEPVTITPCEGDSADQQECDREIDMTVAKQEHPSLVKCVCGNKPAIDWQYQGGIKKFVKCQCGNRTGICETEEEAVERWNKLATDFSKPKQLTRMQMLAKVTDIVIRTKIEGEWGEWQPGRYWFIGTGVVHQIATIHPDGSVTDIEEYEVVE